MAANASAVASIVTSCLVRAAVPGVAQTSREEPISSDRPGQATGAAVVPKGSFQVEAGYRGSVAPDENRLDLGELNLRWGSSSRTELRVEVNSYRFIDRPGDDDLQGLEDPSIGLKFGVGGQQRGARPQMALVVAAGLPLGDRRIGGDKVRPSINWASDWSVGRLFGLTANLEYEWNEDRGERFNQVTTALSLGMSLSRRWGAFIEVYGHNRVTTQGSAVGVADLGVAYLLTNTLQLDAHVGHSLQRIGPERWGGVGVSYRF